MADQIRYDLLTQQALRGVVRNVLADAAKKGLPGDHHFYISFDTRADGVRLSDRLRAQYPDEMTIILQHQFWDLKVGDEEFEVGLSFGGIPERLTVPYEAINGFFDPSVQFGLQFEEVVEGEERQAPANAQDPPAAKKKRLPAAPAAAADQAEPDKIGKSDKNDKIDKNDKPERPVRLDKTDKIDKSDKPAGGGEVVRLDRFRKK